MIDERELLDGMVRGTRSWPGESFCVKKNPIGDEKPIGAVSHRTDGVIFIAFDYVVGCKL